MTTCPSSGNNNNQSAPTGSTPNCGAPHDLICFRCGKKGHMSKEYPEPPQVFAAPVIQEDEEGIPHTPETHNAHNAHDVHKHEHEKWEMTPIPQETEQDTEYSMDSQQISV